MPEVSPSEKGSRMVAPLQIYVRQYLQKYKIIWWNTKIRSKGPACAWPTFQQELINQIVVVYDAFSVDSTTHTSICH